MKKANVANFEGAMSKFYENVPIELHAHRKKLDYFIEELGEYSSAKQLSPKDVRVLEIGCSNGRNISLPLGEFGYRVCGLDIHRESIDSANLANIFANVSFAHGDVYDFEFQEKFDAIILSDILEHVELPGRVLEISKNWLKSGGLLLVCIPNGYGPYEWEQYFLRISRANLFLKFVRQIWRSFKDKDNTSRVAYNHDSGHIQFFSEKKFIGLLNQNLLSVTRKKNGALFGGDALYFLGIFFPFIVKPSWKIADLVSPAFASTWYFSVQKTDKI